MSRIRAEIYPKGIFWLEKRFSSNENRKSTVVEIQKNLKCRNLRGILGTLHKILQQLINFKNLVEILEVASTKTSVFFKSEGQFVIDEQYQVFFSLNFYILLLHPTKRRTLFLKHRKYYASLARSGQCIPLQGVHMALTCLFLVGAFLVKSARLLQWLVFSFFFVRLQSH